jgi:hypothetical protein
VARLVARAGAGVELIVPTGQGPQRSTASMAPCTRRRSPPARTPPTSSSSESSVRCWWCRRRPAGTRRSRSSTAFHRGSWPPCSARPTSSPSASLRGSRRDPQLGRSTADAEVDAVRGWKGPGSVPGARQLRPRLTRDRRWCTAEARASIPELFAEQASRRPEVTAIAGRRMAASYAELESAANQLARALVDRSGGPAGRIGILLRHDAPLIAAALAALKAGTAVVRTRPPRHGSGRLPRWSLIVLTDSAQRLALEAGFPPRPSSRSPSARSPGRERRRRFRSRPTTSPS